MQEYSVEKTGEGREITRGIFHSPLTVPIIKILPGSCRADPKNPEAPRDITWYGENVLKPGIEKGKIKTEGEHDDRKMRYDGTSTGVLESEKYPQEISQLVVRLGHSHFGEYGEKKTRTLEETQRMTQMGLEHFSDSYAFFPRNPGVTGLVKTADNCIILGARGGNAYGEPGQPDRFSGLLQGAAGHLAFRQNPEDVNLGDDMYRELAEEMGITREQVSRLEFLGLFSDPAVGGDDLDFTYLIRTDVPSEYFTSGAWKEKVGEDKREHKNFMAIPDYGSLKELHDSGNFEGTNYDIVFSTRGPMSVLGPKDF